MRGFVVHLSNGEILSEENISWVKLKQYLQNQSDLRITEMRLQYDHQQVCLPNYAKVYFYSKKVEAFIGGNAQQKQYYGIGASSQSPDLVTITWFDGVNTQQEDRKVIIDNPAFIVQ